jgi:hypothetical protein
MNKLILLTIGSVFILSACKSRKMSSGRNSKKELDSSVVMLPEIRNVIKNAYDFDYLSYKARCDYKDVNTEQSFNMNLRMKYDSILWISISAVGFEVVRAKLDNDSVFIINRLEKKYFKYDYSFIQKLAGTSLSLKQIQYLLTSQLVFPPQNFKATAESTKFKTIEGYIENTVIIDSHANIIEQLIQHLAEQSSATILYSDFKKTDKQQFPGKLDISIFTPKSNISLMMENSGISNEKIEAFPFEIPAKYEKGN